jgi:hypothetical protein
MALEFPDLNVSLILYDYICCKLFLLIQEHVLINIRCFDMQNGLKDRKPAVEKISGGL